MILVYFIHTFASELYQTIHFYEHIAQYGVSCWNSRYTVIIADLLWRTRINTLYGTGELIKIIRSFQINSQLTFANIAMLKYFYHVTMNYLYIHLTISIQALLYLR